MSRSVALSLVETLDKQTLGDRAYFQLSELLVSGRMAPGEKISLRQTADVLGVSIMPVREAVSRLVADGALEVTPSRAVRVRVMTAAQFRDLTLARVAIEGHTAALAARNRNQADLKSIGRAEAAMRSESRAVKPNLSRAVELNKAFHFATYGAAHSSTLLDIIRALWLKAGPVINLDLRANPERLAKGDAVRFHADVLNAIKAGDEDGARKGISADINNAADVILSRGGLTE